MNDIVVSGPTQFLALVPKSVDEAVRLAEVISKGTLVPKHLQGKPSDCLMIVMQAQRWGMDAFSVAQCTSVVHGRLCYEGKLVAAVLYGMGAINGRLHYEITGKGSGAKITVTGTPRGGHEQSLTGSVADWRTYTKDRDSGKTIPNAWDNMPEDMLVYRGTRQWARRYAPEALLGIYAPDELEDSTSDDPLPQQPDDLMPKAKPPIEGEFEVVSETKAKPAEEVVETKPTLSEGMQKILNTKLAGAKLTLEQLLEGFGEVTSANINKALQWIKDNAK